MYHITCMQYFHYSIKCYALNRPRKKRVHFIPSN